MGAHVDQTAKSYFVSQSREMLFSELKATGRALHGGVSPMGSSVIRDDRRKSWSVCRHLSTFEGLVDYYITGGSIMMLLGKCFCHDCYEKILSRGDLAEFMDSCRHMTDRGFQNGFIEPLYKINREFLRTRKSVVRTESTRRAWLGCAHVADEAELVRIYSNCIPIFLHEGSVACYDCFDPVPSSSIFQPASDGCETMTDGQLQNRVIDRLYPVNRLLLEAVGHYDRIRWL